MNELLARLAPYLILSGIIILLVLARLLRQAQRQAARQEELTRLNEGCAFDLPDFLRRAWPLLEAAGFGGLTWELDWYGVRLREAAGGAGRDVVRRRLEAPEIRLDITLHHRGRRGEERYFDRSLAEHFLLLAAMDMWIKAGTTRAAFAETARQAVFLQHDMKNIGQFIRLLAEQLNDPAPGREARLFAILQAAMPPLAQRAERILAALARPPAAGPPSPVANGVPRAHDLAAAWQEAALLHGPRPHIEGGATALIGGEQLATIMDNLLANYLAHAPNPGTASSALRINLRQEKGRAVSVIRAPGGGPAPAPERLFEPFWSGRPDGLGIGLYQARQLARNSGGDLEATVTPTAGPTFILTLPAADLPL